jgi:hypothetical protein
LRIIELDEIGRHVPTVTVWLTTHIDSLTGIQPATIARYRTYVARDIDPVFGSLLSPRQRSRNGSSSSVAAARKSRTSTASCRVL